MKPQDTIQFNEKGLVPVITQDYSSNEILMMAWMNKEALDLSIETKKAVYFSRSRKKLWFKGEESGCLLYTSPSPRDQRGSRMPSSA